MVHGFGKELPSEDDNDKSYPFAKKVVLSKQIMDISYTTMEQIPVVTTDPKGSPAAIDVLTAYQ